MHAVYRVRDTSRREVESQKRVLRCRSGLVSSYSRAVSYPYDAELRGVSAAATPWGNV